MTATLLSGRPVADALLESLKTEVQKLDPKLVVVQVGDDPASASYINQKLKSCTAVGMRHEHKHLPDSTTLPELMKLIDELNKDTDVTGFIVQLPLPKQLHHPYQVVKAQHR
jgi:methylenetetrahydrofolate dehydrogenase (NADP+)/methenyltetrahydrofolate cyclohydrolase